jgi:hypothetical protein
MIAQEQEEDQGHRGRGGTQEEGGNRAALRICNGGACHGL